MARPNWEYIRVDVLLPDDPKLDGLTPTAKWTLIELWCWCGQHRTDGFVRQSKWRTFGTPAARTALVKAGLADPVDGGMQMHNYLGHQRSREQIDELSAKRAESGRKGGKAKASAKQVPEQTLEQTASKSLAEAEAEADRSGADVVDHPSRRNARADDDEIDLIISEIHRATGRDISREWAAEVRVTLLAGREVSNPAAYLRQIIRTERDPAARFLPLASSPTYRTVAEAVMAAGVTPNGRPLRGADVAAIAEQARSAMRSKPGVTDDP